MRRWRVSIRSAFIEVPPATVWHAPIWQSIERACLVAISAFNSAPITR
jgi:hypothetical protein